MQFISMDLIGEFHSSSRQGHRYALTIICMHTSYVFCIPIKTKTAQEVMCGMSPANSMDVKKFYLTMTLNSKINCLKKLLSNWAWDTRFTHLPTGSSVMVRWKFFINTSKVVSLNI